MQDGQAFWEFAILYELLFPEEEDREYKCPYCGRVIRGSEKVEWIDKKRGIFKCPDCGKKLNI